ncbi:hypothetical protein TRFO_17701 [Tritrichomonas foetus]|uniref:Uncharacterized protein n=1 Tax=Tritrichomonas foetus TaxID=1144522 RepID=A0A1J4KMU3_9EUKA|nr:hypothetical protein TRFO_17701 [Tritrichomonas foetus]|eukprot:OHT12434.1 hypothetical protein TRFO_17701 [Tritrichomonas foetus]
MLQKTKNFALPISTILQIEYTSLDLDFTIFVQKRPFNFNSTFLASISRRIFNLLLSDPLVREYHIKSDISNIDILTKNGYKVEKSNINDCISLAVELQSDSLFTYICSQYKSMMSDKMLLDLAITAFENGLPLSTIEVELAHCFQNLFLSGQLIEIDESEVLVLTEEINDPPKFVGIKNSRPAPAGLVYHILKNFPNKLKPLIKAALIFKYTLNPPSKNLFLLQFVPFSQIDKSEIEECFKLNINLLRFNIIPETTTTNLKIVGSSLEIDKNDPFNGIMRKIIKPNVYAIPSESNYYSISNIFNEYGFYKTEKNQKGKIEFSFAPFYVSLTKYIIRNPPKEWEISYDNPDVQDIEGKSILKYNLSENEAPYTHHLIDKAKSQNKEIVIREIAESNPCQIIFIEQPENTNFQFSINQIEFYGTVYR